MEMPEKKPWTTPVFKIGDEVKVRKEYISYVNTLITGWAPNNPLRVEMIHEYEDAFGSTIVYLLSGRYKLRTNEGYLLRLEEVMLEGRNNET